MRRVFEMDIEKVDIGKRSILEPCLTAPAPGHRGLSYTPGAVRQSRRNRMPARHTLAIYEEKYCGQKV